MNNFNLNSIKRFPESLSITQEENLKTIKKMETQKFDFTELDKRVQNLRLKIAEVSENSQLLDESAQELREQLKSTNFLITQYQTMISEMRSWHGRCYHCGGDLIAWGF
jgi:hypothetical protein